MRKSVLALLAACALAAPADAATYLRIQSWNGLHMGYANSTDWPGYAGQIWNVYGSTSTAANGMDLVALQEVMYDTAVTSMQSAMNSASGYTWAAVYTAPVGRSSYKERYAILYRTDRLTLISNALYNDVGDKFEREPQIARFRVTATGADLTIINWHAIFGTTAERQAEIAEIKNVYASVQNATTSDQDVILLGDHNKEATSTWWAPLTGLSPAVSYRVNDLTSINSSCAFASAYDHFWYQASYMTEYSSSGRDYAANMCTLYGLSDHAPVWLKHYSTGDDD